MPSSHAQFVAFFAAFFLAHFSLHHPRAARPRTLVNTMRIAEHAVLMLLIALGAALTAYSRCVQAVSMRSPTLTRRRRYHLSYHTPAQIWVGLALGVVLGLGWYYIAEHMPRQPLRLPAPLASPASRRAPSLPARGVTSSVESSSALRKRGPSTSGGQEAPRRATHRRRSSLSALIPELHPAPPLRQLILDHPLAVAFRLRDSWSVWRDGGIEQEYGRWREEWERRRRDWRDALEDSAVDEDAVRIAAPRSKREKVDSKRHYRHILRTLALADKCVPNQTAFCVGCVVSLSAAGKESAALATGYSRELPGNTHAEESALAKLASDASLPTGAELDLYTSMEPCSVRSSGNVPCVQRILAFNAAQQDKATRIVRVFMGVREPPDFVACAGVEELRKEGVEVHTVVAPQQDGLRDGWLEREALRIAKKSHADQPQSEGAERIWRGLA